MRKLAENPSFCIRARDGAYTKEDSNQKMQKIRILNPSILPLPEITQNARNYACCCFEYVQRTFPLLKHTSVDLLLVSIHL